MNTDKVYEVVLPFVGGKENVGHITLKNNVVHLTLKDAGKVEMPDLMQLPEFTNVVLKGSRLSIQITNNHEERIGKMNYTETCNEILKEIPKENIVSVTHCMTRLRIVPVNRDKVDVERLKAINGVLKVVDSSGQIQLVFGPNVSEVYTEFCNITGLGAKDTVSDEIVEKEKLTVKSALNNCVDTLSFIASCAIPGIIAGGMVKGLLTLMATIGLIDSASSAYAVLNAVGDAPFYFLPMLLGYASAKRFKINEIYGLVIAGILMHPTFMNATSGETLQFLFAKIPATSYSSSFFPVILCVWIYSYVFKAVDRVFHKNLRVVFTGCISLMISVPFLLAYVAPFGVFISGTISNVFVFLFDKTGPLAGFLFAAFQPFKVLLGIRGLSSVMMNNLATLGYDFMFPHFFISNIATSGAALAVCLRLKNSDKKSETLTTSALCTLAITEPALYGVLMPNRKAFVGCVLGSGIGGIVAVLLDVKIYAYVMPGIFSLASYIDGTMNLVWCIVSCVTAFVSAFIITFVLMKKESVEN